MLSIHNCSCPATSSSTEPWGENSKISNPGNTKVDGSFVEHDEAQAVLISVQVKINSSPIFEKVSESWLFTSEIPLFTQPTSAPPPSRLPPPRPPRISKSKMDSFSSTSSRNKVNAYPFQNSILYSQSCSKELSDFRLEELVDFVTRGGLKTIIMNLPDAS
jgi:hypothetical protein